MVTALLIVLRNSNCSATKRRTSLRLQFLQIRRIAREFMHEQPLDDPQSDRTIAAGQPTGIEHVCVVAAQLSSAIGPDGVGKSAITPRWRRMASRASKQHVPRGRIASPVLGKPRCGR